MKIRLVSQAASNPGGIRRASRHLLCLALMIIYWEGCRGPAGPAGPAGPIGPAGPTGSANVIYSDWYSPPTWILATTFGIAERSFTMTTSLLTQEIIDHGVILVYMRFVGLNPEINMLPITLPDVNYSFLFRAQVGSIKVLYYRTTSPTTDPGIIPSSNMVRYVLIPGGVLDEAAQSIGITRTQMAGSLNRMPYSEVCRLFRIRE